GDEVELVAFDVGEGRPARLPTLDVAEFLSPEADQALVLGAEAFSNEVEVETILDNLLLGHLVKRQAWSALGVVGGEQDGVLGGGSLCHLPAEDGAPELSQRSGVSAVDRDSEESGAHRQCSLHESVIRLEGRCAPPVRGQMAVRPPSAATTAPVT